MTYFSLLVALSCIYTLYQLFRPMPGPWGCRCGKPTWWRCTCIARHCRSCCLKQRLKWK